MFHSLALGSLIAFLTVLAPLADDDTKPIEGQWAMMSFEENGETAAPDTVKDRVLTIKNDHFTDNLNDDVVAGGKITLDRSKTPWALDATFTEGGPQGETVKAIAEIKDGKLRICAGKPDGDRPTRFETGSGAGAGAWMVEYEKKR